MTQKFVMALNISYLHHEANFNVTTTMDKN